MPIEFFARENTAKVLLEILPGVIAEIIFEEVIYEKKSTKNETSVGR